MEAESRTGVRTELCDQLGISVPIIQAPIGSAVSPELVARVGDAGALGMLAATWTEEATLRAEIKQVRRLGSGRFGANFVLDFPVEDKIDACLDEGVDIISTFWGDPEAVHRQIVAAHAIHIHVVGSVPEARRAAEVGVDIVVAQGREAGGHVRGSVATIALIPAVVDAVYPLPVIAAGGIADGRGIAAALMLGAQAAWIGTRFLVAEESRSHEVYRRAVLDATAEDTIRSCCFDGGWPNAAHRTLTNSTVERWLAAGQPGPPNRPGENETIATSQDGRIHRRYDDTVPLRDMNGALDELALYAGQSAGLVAKTELCANIVATMAFEMNAALRKTIAPSHPDKAAIGNSLGSCPQGWCTTSLLVSGVSSNVETVTA